MIMGWRPTVCRPVLGYTALAVRMKLRQLSRPKISTGPSVSLESRTATKPGWLSATSTQAPPLLLKLLVRHVAREGLKSGASIPRASLELARSSQPPLGRSGLGTRLGQAPSPSDG